MGPFILVPSGNQHAMTFLRFLKWTSATIVAVLAISALLIAILGWNWLRAPIERYTTVKTGRVLTIQGDLDVLWAWHSAPGWPRVKAGQVSFANPAWARHPQMLTADAVEVTLGVAELFGGRMDFPQVRLKRPVVSLEQSPDGKKSWLMDLQQIDQSAMVHVGLVTLDDGSLSYDDVTHKTRIQVEISTAATKSESVKTAEDRVTFKGTGQYKGLPLKASGTGGAVMALWNENVPYALQVDAMVGRTGVRAEGTVTSLTKFKAVDMQMALSGDSLDQLYILTGIASPATRAYSLNGHLVRQASTWSYEKFSGHFGASDIAGSVQITESGKRPTLVADLTSGQLDIADLGPVIGARLGADKVQASATSRVLPVIPFNANRWDSVDAEVSLNAKSIRSDKSLPLDDLVAHASLRNSVMTIKPLDFGVAGGQLRSTVVLDATQKTIQAHAQVRARAIQMARLFPQGGLEKAGVGQINGEFDLSGHGNSVGQMLGTASGKLGLVVANGEISKLMMEKAGLHLWEMLQIKLTGDRPVKLRCAVADFDAKDGKLAVDALVFDTEVNTILGSGTVDLNLEQLDLTLNPRTKNTSPLALSSPIFVRGSFAKPEVTVDKGRVALRALGAVALGFVNPLLAIIPLIDPGPGQDSDCRQLVRDARAIPRATSGQPPGKKRPVQ